jgi:hypothetical protein
MKRDMRFSRRNLLKSLGAGAALIPMLEADPVDAACYVSGLKRLMVFGWANGMLSDVSTWATAGTTPSSWTVADFQNVVPTGQSLLPGMPAVCLGTPSIQEKLMLLHGLNYDFITKQPNPNGGETNGHACFPGMLTGANYEDLTNTDADQAGAISIDQYIANQMVAAGYTGTPSLSLGVFVHSTGRLSWKGSAQAVIPNANPYNVFTTYFNGKLPTTTTPVAAMTSAASSSASSSGSSSNASQIMGTSVLDYVLADLTRFSKIVGTADAQRIANHMQSVRDMETTLSGMTGGGVLGDAGGVATTSTSEACTAPGAAATATNAATQLVITNTANIPTLLKMQFDLSAAAFAADITRVIVLQCGDQGDSNLILTWLGYVSGGPNPADANTGDVNGYHSQAHQNSADKKADDTWFQQMLAYQINQLNSITDTTGKSILDSSLFLAMNNMRTGTHETTQVPVVMAGSLGGYFQTGQSLALTTTNNNSLLLTILNGFGYPTTTFGTAAYCTGGPITQLVAT